MSMVEIQIHVWKRSSLEIVVHVMSGEKRKAPAEWVQPTIMRADEQAKGAYLARFSGVVPPESTGFREYKRKKLDDRPIKDVILQGETERMEYEGKTRGDNVEDACQYYHFTI